MCVLDVGPYGLCANDVCLCVHHIRRMLPTGWLSRGLVAREKHLAMTEKTRWCACSNWLLPLILSNQFEPSHPHCVSVDSFQELWTACHALILGVCFGFEKCKLTKSTHIKEFVTVSLNEQYQCMCVYAMRHSLERN